MLHPRIHLLLIGLACTACLGGCSSHAAAEPGTTIVQASGPASMGIGTGIGTDIGMAPRAPFDETPIGPVETAGAARAD